VENVPDAPLKFREDRRIQRNLVPIRKCIPPFDVKCRVLKVAFVALDIGFKRKFEAIRQTDFTFLGPVMIRATKVNNIVFVNDVAVNLARWKDVGIG